MVKKALCLIILTWLFSLSAWASSNPPTDSRAFQSALTQPSRVVASQRAGGRLYFGLGTGIRNHTGMLGTTLEYAFSEKIAALAGIGLGSWGIRSALGLRYYRNYPYGWGFGACLTGSSGIKNAQVKLESVDNSGSVATRKLVVDLQKASTLNITAFHHWQMGKASRFNLEFGYAFGFQKKPYVFKDDYQLTPKGTKSMQFVQPDGLLIAVGFSFDL